MSKNGEKTEHEYQTEPGGEFKKGNPGGGRPKGQRNYVTIYREALEKLAEINDIEAADLEDELIQRAIKAARDGDYRFHKDIMDRLHGKATQKTELTGKDGEAITITGFNYVTPDETDSE